MHLLILGASGGCGRHATALAHQRGHTVRALVRPDTAFDPPKGVDVVRGSVLDEPTLTSALTGADAVVSCLGLRRRNPLNPWSPVTSPHDLVETVTRTLVRTMPDAGVATLAMISAGGVGDSQARVHPVLNRLFKHSNISIAYRDLNNAERALAASDLHWHAVRPTSLTNAKPTARARAVDRYGLCTRIPRADVAAWLIDAVEGKHAEDRTPMIATTRRR